MKCIENFENMCWADRDYKMFSRILKCFAPIDIYIILNQ